MTDSLLRPSQIDLNVANTGGAQFAVVYNKADEQLYFPFTSTLVDKLAFSGAAGLRAANYDDPAFGGSSGTTIARMIGKKVTISYNVNEQSEMMAVSGTLIQMDEEVAVVSVGTSTVSVKVPSIVSVTAVDLSGKPTLKTQLDNPGKQLVVRGQDSQLSFKAHHTALLEPDKDSFRGNCTVRLATHATMLNGYAWPLEVDKLSLTEHEVVERAPVIKDYRMYATTRAAPPPNKQQAEEAPPQIDGTSGQSGSVEIESDNGPIVLSRSLAHTVVTVSEKMLTNARWHLLGEVDPTTTMELNRVQLDFVVRLSRSDDDGFLLSGPASVQLDMDPLPGDDHLAPVTLPFGFYHNAWDEKNAKRMYHRMGKTSMVTVKKYQTNAMKLREVHNKKENTHVVTQRLRYKNKTPYNAVCKMYLRTRSAYTQVASISVVESRKDRVKLGSFVPETDDDSKEPNTYTLTAVVPPNTGEFDVDLETRYFTRTM